MTKFQTIVLAIIAFAVAGALYKFVPGTPELAMGAATLAAALAGWAKQHPADSVPTQPRVEVIQQPEARDTQKGASNLIVSIVLFVVSVFLGLSYAKPGRADTPISKCWTSICAEPQVSVSVVEYNLATHKIGAGILPVGSVGYGIRDVNDYVAAGLYLSTSIGVGPNYIAPALLVRVMRAITVGVQVRAGEDVTQWSLLAGGGFGL